MVSSTALLIIYVPVHAQGHMHTHFPSYFCTYFQFSQLGTFPEGQQDFNLKFDPIGSPLIFHTSIPATN